MNTRVDVVIIGGGIAGLSAAYYAQQAGLSYAVVEAGTRWGGKVQTAVIDIGREALLRVEYAPDGFITRKPGMTALVRSLGMTDDLIPVNATPERIYVLTRGQLQPLPEGLHLLAPTCLWPFLRSGLFTWRGKLRILCEPFIPPRRDDQDESLAAFVTRRLGREALDKLGEPLLAGVYNADPHEQSILATFGNFRKIEAEHGSLIRGLRKVSYRQHDTSPALMTLRDGMGALVESLVARLTGTLCLGVSVTRITHSDGLYTVMTPAGALHAPHVITATPAPAAAGLLSEVAPAAAAALAKIRYTSVGSLSLAYHVADIPRRLDAYGVVIPSSERRQIDGITWTSAKWPHRAPEGVALIRVFFGGFNTARMLDKSEDERLTIIRAELQSMIGITAPPLAQHGMIWREAYPQYELGHVERVRSIEAALPPGLHLTGNAYHGVGLPDTVSTSQRIIRKIREGYHANHPV